MSFSDTTAIQSPEHLKRWLVESGRAFLVIDAPQFVDALSWPDEVSNFIQMVDQYRVLRSAIPSAYVETGPEGVTSAVMLDDRLGVDEVDAAIAQLQKHKALLQRELRDRGARRE